MRLHVHVNRPEDVFEVARRFGRVEETKAEDMRAQSDAAAAGRPRPAGRVSIVTDTACDLPDEVLEAESIALVPLRLVIGEETFLDRVTITPAEFHRRLRAEGFTARTSQPPPADFREVYGALAAHGSPVVGIHVSGALSGTASAARVAAASLGGQAGFAPVETVDSRTVSVAQGLVVLEAARAAGRGEGLAAVVRAAEDAARRVRLLAAVPSLDALVRGGRVTAGQRKAGGSPRRRPAPDGGRPRPGRARAGRPAGFRAPASKLVEKTLAVRPGRSGARIRDRARRRARAGRADRGGAPRPGRPGSDHVRRGGHAGPRGPRGAGRGRGRDARPRPALTRLMPAAP